MKKYAPQIWQQTKSLISQDFDITVPVSLDGKNAYEQLKEWLSNIINEKIRYDLEGLLNILYRLDIAEKRAMAALNNETPEPVHYALADLIIEREIQKVHTRNWYKQRQNHFMELSTDANYEEVERW